jgi:hypothetical protein
VTCVRMRRLPQRAIELWEQAGSGDWTSGGWASAAAAEDATMARTVAPMELHVGRSATTWRGVFASLYIGSVDLPAAAPPLKGTDHSLPHQKKSCASGLKLL